MDSVKAALGNGGMTVEAAHAIAKDRKEWRALVHIGTYVTESFSHGNFCLELSSFGPPSCALVVITWRWGDAVGINCKKGTTTENQGSGVKYLLRGVTDDCVCVFRLIVTTPPWWR